MVGLRPRSFAPRAGRVARASHGLARRSRAASWLAGALALGCSGLVPGGSGEERNAEPPPSGGRPPGAPAAEAPSPGSSEAPARAGSQSLDPAPAGNPGAADDGAADDGVPSSPDAADDGAPSAPNEAAEGPPAPTTTGLEGEGEEAGQVTVEEGDEGATDTDPAASDSAASDSAASDSAASDPAASDSAASDSAASDPADPASSSPVTVWLAGDSTVANGQTPCPQGWGKVFAPYFDDRVTVRNLAAGGRSVRTWLYEVLSTLDEQTGECDRQRDERGALVLQARWLEMLGAMQPGDYLLIQFGINDGSPTCDRHVGLGAFQEEYGMMAEAARERGAHPVFLTPVSSIACRGAEPTGSRGGFVPATLEAGQRFDVPVIDLHERSVELYGSLGFCPVDGGDVSAETGGPVGDFFCDDHTHFDAPGAVAIAGLVAEGLREGGIALAGYLR